MFFVAFWDPGGGCRSDTGSKTVPGHSIFAVWDSFANIAKFCYTTKIRYCTTIHVEMTGEEASISCCIAADNYHQSLGFSPLPSGYGQRLRK